jgi:hypothetical protein
LADEQLSPVPPLDTPAVADPLLAEPAVALPLPTAPPVDEPLEIEPAEVEPLEIEPLAPDDPLAIEPVEDAPLEPLEIVKPEEPPTGATEPPHATTALAATSPNSAHSRIPAICDDPIAFGSATRVPSSSEYILCDSSSCLVPLCAKVRRSVIGHAERPSA